MNSYFGLVTHADYKVDTFRREAQRERLAAEARQGENTAPRVRFARPADRAEVLAFLQRLSPETLHARYLSPLHRLTGNPADREVERLLDGDGARHIVLVAEEGRDVRGIGEFAIDPDLPHMAELALTVEDAFQHRGIGLTLYRRLEELARRRGVTAFTGDVQHENYRVLDLFRRNRPSARLMPGVASVRFRLEVE